MRKPRRHWPTNFEPVGCQAIIVVEWPPNINIVGSEIRRRALKCVLPVHDDGPHKTTDPDGRELWFPR